MVCVWERGEAGSCTSGLASPTGLRSIHLFLPINIHSLLFAKIDSPQKILQGWQIYCTERSYELRLLSTTCIVCDVNILVLFHSSAYPQLKHCSRLPLSETRIINNKLCRFMELVVIKILFDLKLALIFFLSLIVTWLGSTLTAMYYGLVLYCHNSLFPTRLSSSLRYQRLAPHKHYKYI